MIKNEYTFNFKSKGSKTKKTFEGDFTVKCLLSNQEMVEVSLRQDRYNGGSETIAKSGTGLMNRAVAFLEVAIVKAPSFWKDSDGGRTLLDPNIVYEVFNQALDGEKDYEKRLEEEVSAAEKDAETSQEAKKAKDKK